MSPRLNNKYASSLINFEKRLEKEANDRRGKRGEERTKTGAIFTLTTHK